MKTLLYFPLVMLLCFYAFSANAQNYVPCEPPYPQIENLTAAVNLEAPSVDSEWTPILGSL